MVSGISEPTTQNHNLETADGLHRLGISVAHALTKLKADEVQALSGIDCKHSF